ncbi:MAG: hypothetical protein ACFFCS_00500 [Candidatus Hodarchaeota archaeon]
MDDCLDAVWFEIPSIYLKPEKSIPLDWTRWKKQGLEMTPIDNIGLFKPCSDER